MFGSAKYIVARISNGAGSSGITTPIIFPSFIAHDDIVQKLGLSRDEVKSAGFVQFSAGENDVVNVETFGESLSLKIRALPGDGLLIERSLGLGDT